MVKLSTEISDPIMRASDLGILRHPQAVFYALAFFQSDGFAAPTPARVTHTFGRLHLEFEYGKFDLRGEYVSRRIH